MGTSINRPLIMKSGAVHHSTGTRHNRERRMNKKILLNSPPFGASVLEPCFDLGVRHFKQFGQSGPLSRCQVFLFMESLL